MYMAFMENAYSVRYKQERLTYELLTLEVCMCVSIVKICFTFTSINATYKQRRLGLYRCTLLFREVMLI